MQYEICLFIEKHRAPCVAVRTEGRFHQLPRQKDDMPNRALSPGNLQRGSVDGGLLPQAPNELLTAHCDLKPESFEHRCNRGADLLVTPERGDKMKLCRSVRLGRPLSNKPMQVNRDVRHRIPRLAHKGQLAHSQMCVLHRQCLRSCLEPAVLTEAQCAHPRTAA